LIDDTDTAQLEPIGQCQGWPASNLYLETTTNTTFPYLNSSISGQATTTAPERADAAASAGFGNGAVAAANLFAGSEGWMARVGLMGVVAVVGALSVF
jgi:hypothetical protein